MGTFSLRTEYYAQNMDKPMIELSGLSVDLAKRRILDNLNASVRGQAVGLLGPNGAGKSTLISTLLGFYPPSAGEVRVLGMHTSTQPLEVRRRVGYMPENDSFIAGMSAVRFVRLMGELSGLQPKESLERAHEALFYVGLGEARYRPLETYSQGMKQLAKLAQAIVHGPELLLLDEPTNAMDPPHRAKMLKLVKEIKQSGNVRLLISSHLLKDVEETCDEVLILKDGKIAAACDLEKERQANLRFLHLDLEGNMESFLSAVHGLGCETATVPRRESELRVLLPEGIQAFDLLRVAQQTKARIRKLIPQKDSLQDIFDRAMEEPN